MKSAKLTVTSPLYVIVMLSRHINIIRSRKMMSGSAVEENIE